MSLPVLIFKEAEARTVVWQIVTLPDGRVSAVFGALPAGMTAKNLTGFSAIVELHNIDAVAGTNKVAASATIPTPANGQVSFTFTASHTTIAESTSLATGIQGEYTVLLTNGTETHFLGPGEARISRNAFLPTT